MRSLILLSLATLLHASSYAQFGNEWIDYNQQYWRFQVAQDRFVRISYDELLNAGFPVNTVDPELIRMYSRGQEQVINIVGSQDGSFDQGDFIEVYVRKNDGWLDTQIYDDPANQANRSYSLFNDTASYFITAANQPGARTTLYSPQTNPDNLNPLPFVSAVSRQDYTDEYLIGQQDQNGISLPWYEEAEGWFDNRFPKGATRNKTIPHPGLYQGSDAPPVRINATSASASSAQGFFNHHLQVGYGNPLNIVVDTVYFGYQLNRFSWEVEAQELAPASTVVTHRSVDDLGVATDWHAVGWIAISYPRTPVFEAGTHEFTIDGLPAGVSEARLDFTYAGASPRLFVLGNGLLRECQVQAFGNGYRSSIPIPAGGAQTRLLLLDGDSASPAGGIAPATPTGFFSHYADQQLDSAFVIVTHPSLLTAANNYTAYRQSQGMDALVVNVEELYMQYAAGIWKHPLAIRRFCDELLSTWPSKPSHLFLVGKSIFEMNLSATVGARNNPAHYARNLVPSWGYPTSDIAFTAGLDGTLTEMAIPTGRLAAPNQTTVLEYLNKVVEFEAQPPAAWMKRVLHFGGGGNAAEQNLFRGYLNNYRTIAQDTCFGGRVYSFFKTSTDPIQLNLSDSIQMLINDGVSVMTFFGHASSTGFDVNIDEPSSYNNQGKYPLLIGNSCYTGNVHLPDNNSASEIFTLAPSRGVIAFIAKGDLGAPQTLNLWTSNYYRNLLQKNYGKSIGQCMRYAVEDFQSPNMSFFVRNTALTFGLHGDPAIVLNAWPKPDYAITADDIVFEPKEVSAELETFRVKIAVGNIGKAVNRTFGVELIRRLPNGTDTSLVAEIGPVLFSDTVVFELPVDPINGVGLNTFDVLVDFPADEVPELDDVTNNRVFGKELFITSGSLIPIYPFNFAIEPTSGITLKASTGNPLAPARPYVMQFDTTDTFNSPFMLSTNVTQSGGVIEWDVPVNAVNERVYYWRTAAVPDPGEAHDWRLHSFQYVSGERGWGQSHFQQFRNNAYNRIEWNEPDRRFDFTSGEQDLRCTVYGNASGGFAANATRYQIDLEVMDYAGCGSTPALHVAVIDPVTLAPWESNFNNQNPENDFGNLMTCANGRGRPEKYFIFRQNNPGEMAGAFNLLNSGVPDGHYLLVYTWRHADFDGWSSTAPGMADLFMQLGSEQMTTAQDSVPFIFFVRKGTPSAAIEVFGASIDDQIELEATLAGSFGVGSITSPAFGPVNAWEAAYWNFTTEPGDSTQVRVLSGLPAGSASQLADFPEDQNEWQQLGAEVSADLHPKLRLQTELRDPENQTPSQIRSWQLMSDHVPECALNASRGYWFPKDTVQQGEPLPIAIAIENIGQYDMDSLLVRYSVTGPGTPNYEHPYPRRDSLRVGEFFIDTVYISTAGMRGENRLRVEANPRGSANIPDQPEQTHVNNIAELRFHVIEDRINPLLDVTFDGRHILNGDIVSARPHIHITLNDENPFLLLDEPADTANFKMFLTWPNGNQHPVYFSQYAFVTFYPATDADNKSAIEYRPHLDEDGEYRLLVQAQDKSGNASGKLDFRVDFEVYSKPTITEVLNYPNPFSTRTQFVFTVTGTEPPDEIMIRIMTIAGNVVREIRADELGPITIGRNRSSFWWDGTDMYGDRLANGIYLYSVKARLRGEELEYRSTVASPFFKNGMGKMYLLR